MRSSDRTQTTRTTSTPPTQRRGRDTHPHAATPPRFAPLPRGGIPRGASPRSATSSPRDATPRADTSPADTVGTSRSGSRLTGPLALWRRMTTTPHTATMAAHLCRLRLREDTSTPRGTGISPRRAMVATRPAMRQHPVSRQIPSRHSRR